MKPTTICNIELDIPTLLTKPQNTQAHQTNRFKQSHKIEAFGEVNTVWQATKNEVIAHSVTEI